MASRQIKMRAKNGNAEQEAEEVLSQSKRPERGRFLLQVDRQTKNSYTTSEAAQSAALAISRPPDTDSDRGNQRMNSGYTPVPLLRRLHGNY